MNKKGQLLQGIGLLVIAVAFFILVLVLGLFTWLLNKNLFVLIGVLLVVVSLIMFVRGVDHPITIWLLFIWIAFLITPTVFKQVGGITLASVLP